MSPHDRYRLKSKEIIAWSNPIPELLVLIQGAI